MRRKWPCANTRLDRSAAIKSAIAWSGAFADLICRFAVHEFEGCPVEHVAEGCRLTASEFREGYVGSSRVGSVGAPLGLSMPDQRDVVAVHRVSRSSTIPRSSTSAGVVIR